MKKVFLGAFLGVLVAVLLMAVGSLITIDLLSRGVHFELPTDVVIVTEEHNFGLVGK